MSGSIKEREYICATIGRNLKFIIFSSPHQTIAYVNYRTVTFFGSKARLPISKVIVVLFP